MEFSWLELNSSVGASLHGLSLEEARAALSRWQFGETADRLRASSSAGTLFSINELFARGLQKNEIPLEILYAFPDLSLVDEILPSPRSMSPDNTGNIDNPIPLYQALANMGEPPVDETGKRLLGGWNQYNSVIKNPEYYVLGADNQCITTHIAAYVEAMDKANVVELCIGTGKKASRLYNLAFARGARPKKFYINDIVGEVVKTAAREVCQGGFNISPKQIELLTGDINSNKFWEQEVFRQLKEDKASTCVFMHGATFNDLSPFEMRRLLKAFRSKFKKGTSFFVSVDSTMDVPTLLAAYDHPRARQWALTGFVQACWAGNIDIDPRALECKIRAEARQDCVAIQHIMTVAEAPNVMSGLPQGDLPFHEIRKISPETISSMVQEAGLEEDGWLPFNGGEKFGCVDSNILRWRNGEPKKPSAKRKRKEQKVQVPTIVA